MIRQAASRGEPGWGDDLGRDGDGVGVEEGRHGDDGVGVPTAAAAVFRVETFARESAVQGCQQHQAVLQRIKTYDESIE
jgi:hypothetical protein